MALMPYIFGGSTGIRTPQEAAHLRAIAEALAGQRRAPHTIGEGLSAIGDAIASRRYRMRGDRMESEGRANWQKNYGDLLPSLFGGDGGAVDPVPTAPGGEVPQPPDMSHAGVGSDYGAATNIATSQLPPPEDLAAIVRTVIGEAGNQTPEGQRAVAEVILNRARESGMTPMQVVMAKGQFEPWMTRGSELNAIDPNSQQYQSVLGNITPAFGPDDPTGGADHFYSPGAQAALGRDVPDWARGQQGTDIGDHRFYSLGYGGDPGTSGAQDATAAQASGHPGVTQVADSGGFDPRIFDALNDPWVPEGTKAVLGAILEQQLKERAPKAPISLSPGERLLDPRDYHVLATGGEDLPNEAKMFQWAQAHGFNGSIEDWQRLKGTNVSIGGKTLDAEYAKDFHDILTQGRDAQSTLGSLNVMEQAMSDPGFYSGAGGETVLQLKRFGAALGMNPEGISSMETFQSQAKQLALAAMGGSLGSGFSNADRDFVTGQVAGLENTPAGNKKLLAITRELTKRKIQIADLAGRYADMPEHGGQIDRGFDAYLRQWAEANPLFPQQKQAPPDPSEPLPDPSQYQEGQIIENDQRQQFKLVNGKWEPVQ